MRNLFAFFTQFEFDRADYQIFFKKRSDTANYSSSCKNMEKIAVSYQFGRIRSGGGDPDVNVDRTVQQSVPIATDVSFAED